MRNKYIKSTDNLTNKYIWEKPWSNALTGFSFRPYLPTHVKNHSPGRSNHCSKKSPELLAEMRFAKEENHRGELAGSNRNEGSREEAILMSGGDAREADVRSRIAWEEIEALSPSLFPFLFLPARQNDHLSETFARVSTNGTWEGERKALLFESRMTTPRARHTFAVPSALNPAGFRWIIRAVPRIASFHPLHRIRLCALWILTSYITSWKERIK